MEWYFLSMFVMSICYAIVSLIMIRMFDRDNKLIKDTDYFLKNAREK